MDETQVSTPGSDAWWVARLMRQLGENAREAAELRLWMDGRPPLPVPDNQRPRWERLQELASVNLAALLVKSRVHRLDLTGARTRVDDSPNGDDVLRGMFEEQDLAHKLRRTFRRAMSEGRGYAFLGGDGTVRVTDAMHAAVEYDADGIVTAAISIHRDDVKDRDVLILCRPGYYRMAYHEGVSLLPNGRDWLFYPEAWELGEVMDSGFEFVPAYEFAPDDGSIIAAHKRSLRRINHGILQRMVIIAMQAFRQRGMIGLPDVDENGNRINYDGMFESEPDALWMIPEGVEMWESGQADIQPVLAAVRDDIKFLAVESGTPLYLISPDDANGSATGADTQREVIVFDVKALRGGFESTLKRLLSDMLTLRGETDRAERAGIEILWENEQRSSITERAEAVRAAKDAGVPFRVRLEKFGEFTPSEIERAEEERAEEIFMDAVAAQTTAPAASPGTGAGVVEVTGG